MSTLAAAHDHPHALLPDAVVPTPEKVNADPDLRGRGVTIAFLDSGFVPHPDLAGRIRDYHDVVRPDAPLEAEAAPSWAWHGTMTSVVAAGNGSLSEGVYRGLASEADVVLVKVSDQGRIREEAIEAGLRWVLENRERLDIRIVSISLGGDEAGSWRESAVNRVAEEAVAAGLFVVAAAGNSGATESHQPVPPANAPSVLAVGGYDDDGDPDGPKRLWNSSFGPTADGLQKPEVVAPSIWVAAPILPGTSAYAEAEALSQLAALPNYRLRAAVARRAAEAGLPKEMAMGTPAEIRGAVEAALARRKVVATHYQHVDGTSFAAPIVASLAAQMLEANPSLGPRALRRLLMQTSRRLPGEDPRRQGRGVVDARAAVAAARAEAHAHEEAAGPVVLQDRIVFTYHDDAATRVHLVADHTGWDVSALPFVRTGSVWRAEMARPAIAEFKYKILVDGTRWLEDPANGRTAPDGWGGLNSVLHVAGNS